MTGFLIHLRLVRVAIAVCFGCSGCFGIGCIGKGENSRTSYTMVAV